MRKRISFILVCTGIAAASLLAEPAPSTQPSSSPAVEPAQVSNGMRSVPAYPVLWPEMPDKPGRDIYLANCVQCHSQYYVLMQPNFPRKTWQAEVEKMKKTYGGPIDDAVMPKIVDYLMAVRGK